MEVKKSNKTTKKTIVQKAKQIDWFAVRGYRASNKNDIGFLRVNKDRKNLYEFVEDIDDAVKFPSENVYKQEGFGTPQQWLKFFKGEEALSDWKFHLVKLTKS